MKKLLAKVKRKVQDRESDVENGELMLTIDELSGLYVIPDAMTPYEPICGHVGQIVDGYNMRQYFDKAFSIERKENQVT